MKFRIGTKPVYSARNYERHVRIISIIKRFLTYADYENNTYAELESKTYGELEYEENEV